MSTSTRFLGSSYPNKLVAFNGGLEIKRRCEMSISKIRGAEVETLRLAFAWTMSSEQKRKYESYPMTMAKESYHDAPCSTLVTMFSVHLGLPGRCAHSRHILSASTDMSVRARRHFLAALLDDRAKLWTPHFRSRADIARLKKPHRPGFSRQNRVHPTTLHFRVAK